MQYFLYLLNFVFQVLVIAQVIHLFITSWKYPWIKFDYDSLLNPSELA